MEILSAANDYTRMNSLPLSPGNNSNKILHNDSVRSKESIEAQKAKLREAAEGFEAIFARQILKTMRSTLTDGGMFGEGASGEIFSDLMDNAMAEKIAGRGELGLADVIYRQMVKSIER